MAENVLLHIGHISYIHSPAGCENKERWERNLRSKLLGPGADAQPISVYNEHVLVVWTSK